MMKTTHCFVFPAILVGVLLFLAHPASATDQKKPLRVYIMAGQSNMVGTGAISGFDYIGQDPETAPLLKSMLNENGEPRTCDRVWISSLNGKYRTEGGVGAGKLSAGYGFRKDPTQPGDCIGPEYTFGITMEKNYDGPILIIKTGWGGKSLHVDYRPPSAGPYVMQDEQIEKLKAKDALERKEAENKAYTSKYYRYMIAHVTKVLGDIKDVYPAYDPTIGYEIAGFVWFQGWNDYAATGEYLLSDGDQQYARYSHLIAHFIRDVRKDLDTPKLPFVIGVMGVHGNFTPGLFNPAGSQQLRMERLRKAMAAPAQLAEFKGNVIAVPTAPFWDDALGAIEMKYLKVKQMRSRITKKAENGPNADGSMTRPEIQAFMDDYTAKILTPEEIATRKLATGSGGFVHYYGSAKFHAQAGQAFAKALLTNAE